MVWMPRVTLDVLTYVGLGPEDPDTIRPGIALKEGMRSGAHDLDEPWELKRIRAQASPFVQVRRLSVQFCLRVYMF